MSDEAKSTTENDDPITVLKSAIQEGVDSGIATDFDPKKHLKLLKSQKQNLWKRMKF